MVRMALCAVSVTAAVCLCAIPAWGADVNVHHGIGNVVGTLIAGTSNGTSVVEIYVRTAYPQPTRVLSYDCLSSRSQAVRNMCMNVVNDVPALMLDCGNVQHAVSGGDGYVLDYWVCDQGVGKCIDTWSELGDTDGDGTQLPEVQALNVISSSNCSPK